MPGQKRRLTRTAQLVARWVVLIVSIMLCVFLTSGCFSGGTKPSAQLAGVVTSYVGDRTGATSEPVAGAKVAYGSKSVLTSADGSYKLVGLVEGTGTLVVSKGKGYPAQEFSATVAKGATRQLNVTIKNLHQLCAMQGESTPSVKPGSPRKIRSLGTGSDNCSVCHSVEAPQGSMKLANSTNALCSNTECHVTSGTTPFQHPAAHLDPAGYPGVRPTGRYVEYTDLSCITCHRPHRDSSAWVATDLLATSQASLASNCVQCHATLPSTHPSIAGQQCSTCHDAASGGTAKGHASCSGYSGSFGLPCHRSSSTIATGTHANAAKLPNGCKSCHDVAGTPNAKLLRWPNDNQLCKQCHTSMPTYTATGHGKCNMCHDPHRVEPGKMKNPANPAGALIAVAKELYRSQTLIKNDNCLLCHKTAPPAGYSTAKDPYTQAQFTNTVAAPDMNLHRVHVLKIRPDAPYNADRSYDHPEYPYRGDINDARCTMCHSKHPNGRQFNLLTVISSRTKTGTGYSGKAGCGVGNNCHTCNYCHAEPGGPGVDCQCGHGNPGYHGIVY